MRGFLAAIAAAAGIGWVAMNPGVLDIFDQSSRSDCSEADRAAGREFLRKYAENDPMGVKPGPGRDRDLQLIRDCRGDHWSEAGGPSERVRHVPGEVPEGMGTQNRRAPEPVRDLADRYSVSELKRRMDEAYVLYQERHREGFALWAKDTYDEYLLYKQALDLKRRQARMPE